MSEFDDRMNDRKKWLQEKAKEWRKEAYQKAKARKSQLNETVRADLKNKAKEKRRELYQAAKRKYKSMQEKSQRFMAEEKEDMTIRLVSSTPQPQNKRSTTGPKPLLRVVRNESEEL